MSYIPVSELSEEQYIIRRDKWRIAQQKTRDAVNERNRKSRTKLKEKIAEKRNIEEAKLKKALCDRLYREKNKEKISIQKKIWQEQNKEHLSLKSKIYREQNKEKISEYWQKLAKENPEKISLYRETEKNNSSPEKRRAKKRTENYKIAARKRQNERYRTDIQFRLKRILRARMAQGLKSQSANKIGQTIELTGCSVQELKMHLESQFKEGMSWSNYGKQKDNRLDSWEIDHIIPISTFDLTDEDQQRKCWHYTNLQPLWAIDNLQKRADPNWQKS